MSAPVVAALYVEDGGAYFGLEGVDPWPESRDARLYAGPWPVVAHPPCHRWSTLAPWTQSMYGHKVGDDGGCFTAAVQAVRTYGGVLEHPAYSLAWSEYGLPAPSNYGGWSSSLWDIGSSCYVEQGRYGHSKRKGTWLYVAHVDYLPELRWGFSHPGIFDGWVGGQRRDASSTPGPFLNVLLSLARSVSVSAVAAASPSPETDGK